MDAIIARVQEQVALGMPVHDGANGEALSAYASRVKTAWIAMGRPGAWAEGPDVAREWMLAEATVRGEAQGQAEVDALIADPAARVARLAEAQEAERQRVARREADDQRLIAAFNVKFETRLNDINAVRGIGNRMVDAQAWLSAWDREQAAGMEVPPAWAQAGVTPALWARVKETRAVIDMAKAGCRASEDAAMATFNAAMARAAATRDAAITATGVLCAGLDDPMKHCNMQEAAELTLGGTEEERKAAKSALEVVIRRELVVALRGLPSAADERAACPPGWRAASLAGVVAIRAAHAAVRLKAQRFAVAGLDVGWAAQAARARGPQP